MFTVNAQGENSTAASGGVSQAANERGACNGIDWKKRRLLLPLSSSSFFLSPAFALFIRYATLLFTRDIAGIKQSPQYIGCCFGKLSGYIRYLFKSLYVRNLQAMAKLVIYS